MQTLPSGKMFGCHISDLNLISGGLQGKSLGKVKVALKQPPSQSVSGEPENMMFHLKRLLSSSRPKDQPSCSSLWESSLSCFFKTQMAKLLLDSIFKIIN
ncbi:hypothetical protein FGO68_gene16892 [Halteria grandinella]|uniref:Uncharacterized protein n=1 Tax=Halteria grandinella TaxID=5974 RepID=A0A8J8P3R4_HALGN|nr:hypothetical protein FGO68_gene16892 [Halteria grandinella]